MKLNTLLFALIFSLSSLGLEPIKKEDIGFTKKVFNDAHFRVVKKIPDPISKEANNKTIYEVYNSKKVLIGYQRHINTTTGCNSACLPVIFDLFYSSKGSFVKLYSKIGLTKKFHRPFTPEDYARLEMLMLMNPSVFKEVGYPTEMVDALSGATLKKYEDSVVKEAAYSTLRINLYNQQTLKFIRKKK